jgi:hypothetical protein
VLPWPALHVTPLPALTARVTSSCLTARLLPYAQVIAKNGAVPGTPSAYALMCLELMIDEDVDIVFIEYVLNDGFDNVILDSRVGKIYERLVRKILAKPNMPAVVMMQVSADGGGHDAGGC